MLSSILSESASDLYRRMIEGTKVVSVTGARTDPAVEGTPAQELVDMGLAALVEREETLLVPVEPAAAQATLTASIMDQLEQLQRRLTDSHREFAQIHELYKSSETLSDPGHAHLLTDPHQIMLLSQRMVIDATEEVRVFNNAEHEDRSYGIPTVVPVSRTSSLPPPIRTIYTPDCLQAYGEAIDESVAAGEEARLFADLPTKMNIVGRSQAMVALDRTGLHATLFIRSRPLIDALRLLFELVWERATPYPAAAQDDSLSPQEQRVIALLATGAKDEAIARQLDVTVRTVRRHITAAMTKLGAENRFAAGVLATKRGWI